MTAALFMWSCEKGNDSSNRIWLRSGDSVDASAGRQRIEIVSETSWWIDFSYDGADAGGWCTLITLSGSGDGYASFDYEANAGEERYVDVIVNFGDGDVKTVRMTQAAAEEPAENLAYWLEIPAFASPLPANMKFVRHFVPGDDAMRNYSIMYDTENHIPIWVAYPMHSIYTRNDSGRTNAWQWDPKIDTGDQANLYGGIAGYDRGHMLPSASRYLKLDGQETGTNEQTFYFTNMTPQINSFNANLWAAMEGKVRDWKGSGADTLYVVTGAVLRTAGGNESITYTYGRQDTGKKIAVPNYYYKALLKRSVKSDGSLSYKGVAFWFEHRYYDRETVSWSEDAISIDGLEALTGIDFFASLDDDLQNEVESQRKASDWGFSN